MRYNGSCLCGKVTFEIIGEFDNFYLCHCERCRKDTGSAHAANLFSKKATLNWITGQSLVITYEHNNEGHVKSFCSVCGSALPTVTPSGKLLAVPAGSLDSDIFIEPDGHIYISHKANWDSGLEKIKKYDELPE